MSAKQGRIYTGIGGWTYEPWRGLFYPKGLPHAKELAYASRALTSIEINGCKHWLDPNGDGDPSDGIDGYRQTKPMPVILTCESDSTSFDESPQAENNKTPPLSKDKNPIELTPCERLEPIDSMRRTIAIGGSHR